MSAQKITIHQFHYSATSGDAITNQLLFIQDALREVGIGGEVFAKEIKNLPEGRVRRLHPDYLWSADLVLLHHSQGNPTLQEILKIEVPKALVYHNITPAEYFRHDPYVSNLCHLGRKQLLLLRPHVVTNFADSAYNSFELEAVGYPRSAILPLFDLPAITPPKRKSVARELLFVGRIAPHKNQALLVKSLYYLNRYSEKPWKLVLVGGSDPIYGEYLKMLTRSLGLSKYVDFAGKLSDSELKKRYARAAALVCASEHEGFCIPLVEAMRAGVPIFSLINTGIKETLGPAGLHVATKRPHRIAAVWKAALDDKRALDVILRGQAKRLGVLREMQSKARVQIMLPRLVEALRSAPGRLPRPSDLEVSP